MTITMTAKHQVTIPIKITSALGLSKGDMFDVQVNGNRIELVPVEIVEKVFTEDEYAKLDDLCAKEEKQVKRVTKKFIDSL